MNTSEEEKSNPHNVHNKDLVKTQGKSDVSAGF